MSLGLLIKFYREKKALTQEELGKGICSVTHISKIERGNTQYSPEITHMLSEKLGIDLEKEMQSLQRYERLLDQWHDSMVLQQESEIERLKSEVEKNSLFLIQSVKNKYFLLQSRYYLLQGNIAQAENLLDKMKKHRKELNSYEHHLLHHLLGIIEMLKGNFKNALNYLLQINEKEYLNHEFFYQIAIAYHNLQFKVKAYHYSEVALDYFRKTNNFKKVIDAETIKLINEGRNELWDFEELVERYNRLIAQCDILNETSKKAALLSNLAYEHSFAGDNESAGMYYKKTLTLLEKNRMSPVYLNNLIGYVYCCLHIEGDREERDLKQLIDTGSQISKNIHDKSSFLFFEMLRLLHEGKKKQYYRFIEEQIIPMLEENGKHQQLYTYVKTMYEHYLNQENPEKALHYAKRLIENC
ncbi:helix-turn-helix domain-containing protein [Rossellomorea aquimaris]|uniref:helix-turn-helix domain-containing protein n=1 Tax=Rossellomorea aquimaris TaxID=189382 RepID=UPI0005C8E6A2|nr:helix-turn-helix transcriptional regulator [Rossellomorea aquimaris]